MQIGSRRVGPGIKQGTTVKVHATSSTKEIKSKHKNMVKVGKCFGGIPMGTLRNVPTWSRP